MVITVTGKSISTNLSFFYNLVVVAGETYFNASEQPHVYFQMLFLTGQFEAGIEILYRSAKFATHSVHIAIAMNELGLLALSDNISRPVGECKTL